MLATAATRAFDAGSEEEQAKVKKIRFDIAAKFWAEAGSEGESTKVKPIYRTKAYQWLGYACHTLTILFGQGGSHSKQPEKMEGRGATHLEIRHDSGGSRWLGVPQWSHFLESDGRQF